MRQWIMAATAAAALAAGAGAQQPPPPAGWTAEQDHQAMMDQLGIRRLRPGPSGDETAPNHANYDPSLANPYPDWPDLMRLANGRPVTTADMWTKQRRPEIVEAFEREVLGRIPADAPAVRWTEVAIDRETIARRPTLVRRLIGHADNSRFPAIAVDIQMTLVLPAQTTKPVPVLIMFGPSRWPAPSQPNSAEATRINDALKALLGAQDPALAEAFRQHPGFEFVRPATPFGPPAPGSASVDSRVEDLVSAGWGVALLDPTSVQADNGAGLRSGIIGLTNRGQPRKPEDWGALRAWGWGASRALDYLQTVAAVDRAHVGIEGVSRYGKAALVAAAFDPRFAMVLVGSSGEGGAKPHRRNFGEAVESLTATGEYHWMAGNFLKYGAAEAKFGSKTPNDLPVDSHELIALVAPRLAFISYGVPEQGDAKWLDQQGSYMATIAAGRAWTLLGAKDLGKGNDYKAAMMPPPETDLLDGELAWRQHTGGHTDTPNMKPFIAWVNRKIGWTPPR